jgi:hypothetical protein
MPTKNKNGFSIINFEERRYRNRGCLGGNQFAGQERQMFDFCDKKSTLDSTAV